MRFNIFGVSNCVSRSWSKSSCLSRSVNVVKSTSWSRYRSSAWSRCCLWSNSWSESDYWYGYVH